MRCGVVRITAHAHLSNLLSKGHGAALSGTIYIQGHNETDVRVCTHAHAARTHIEIQYAHTAECRKDKYMNTYLLYCSAI